MNYEFCYYCFSYLSSFEERGALYVDRRTERRHECLKVDLDDCIDIETLELFSLNWWNNISSRFQFEEVRRYLVPNQFWDGQKSSFSLWKRFVNNVRVKIRCYETKMSWAAKSIKESSFLIIQMTRWLAWIRLFDFDVRHVLDKRHTAADELSRRPRGPSNDIDEVYEKNIDDFIDDQLNCVRVCSMRVNENDDEQPLKNEYSEKSQKVTHYLTTLARPNHLNRKKFRKFKNWVLQFLVRDRHLFRRVNKNVLLQKIIDKTENQAIILKQLHDESEHRGREEIYRRVTDRY